MDASTRATGADTPAGSGSVKLTKIGEFSSPVQITQPPGSKDQLVITEKAGRLALVRDGDVLSEPFLDITDQVSTGSEQGLLSVAFDPGYAKSGLFYVDYTDRDGNTQVVEYRRSPAIPEVADPDSARTVLTQEQPFDNHNGGLLLFGPDRRLYIGFGDGGSANDPQRNGQDLSTWLGKILRISPHPSNGRPYSVPADNPFNGQQGARPEIFAFGLRNPWRFSFDRDTGALWIGDVGQDRYEEVDSVQPDLAGGFNFGWSALEGNATANDDQSAPGSVRPVFTYGHDAGCSVTGGYVVRDPRLGSLRGDYLFGDFCTSELKAIRLPAGADRAKRTDARRLEVKQLVSFGEDGRGRLYAVSLEGPVYRIDPAG